MRLTSDTDVFYYDALNEVGFHMHEESNGRCTFMKNTGRQITPISEEEFIKAVNEQCHLNGINADSYFTFK